MGSKKLSKSKQSLHDLDRALKAYVPTEPGEPRSLSFFALSKAFEVALEYGWKGLKIVVEDKGLEAFSPKDAVREAARLGMINEPEVWIRAINARNLSVHDYFAMSEHDFVALVAEFANELTITITIAQDTQCPNS